MLKIAVLDTDYPAPDNLYGDVFVHTRVKEYQKSCDVEVISFFRKLPDYTYEGVKVVHANTESDIFEEIGRYKPNVIFIHFYNRRLFGLVSAINIPVVIWVHGYEALGWYRRLFNYSTYQIVRNIHNIVPPNVKQMAGMRQLIAYANRNPRIYFVFVSEWMKKVTETDALKAIRNSFIIPNPINTSLFGYRQKTADHRRKILLIRSFNSRKYANDLAVEAILHLSKTEIFSDLQFAIYGSGKFFSTLTSPLKAFNNVVLHEYFVPNQDIPSIHSNYGIFLCPTRQDAQGVSMCEAMSSGLVPVTSRNTAIPEFVEHGVTGITGRKARDLANGLTFLYSHPETFLSISAKASAFISRKCGISHIVKQELALFPHPLS